MGIAKRVENSQTDIRKKQVTVQLFLFSVFPVAGLYHPYSTTSSFLFYLFILTRTQNKKKDPL